MMDKTTNMETPAFIGSLVDASPDLFFFKDADFIYRYANKAFGALFELAITDIVGHSDFELFPADSAARHREADQQVLASGRVAAFEYEVVRQGRSVWLQVVKTPVRDASGVITGIFCTARNITFQKQFEADARLARRELEKNVAERAEDLRRVNQELRRQIDQRQAAEIALEESLRTVNLIVDNSPIGIVFVTERIVRRANARFHELFATPDGGLVGKSTALCYPDRRSYEEFGRQYYPILGQGRRVDTVRSMRRKDGTVFWCRIIGQVLFPDRPQAGSIWLMEDVTEQRLAEEATLAAERLKREFMDTMSHEIRTPLNGIVGMLEMLAATNLSEEQRDYADTLRQCTRDLDALVESILDFSRLDAGGEHSVTAPFVVREIVQGVLDSFGASAREKGLRLALCLEADVPPEVVGDAAGLRRVLAALVGNAVKFTDVGSVTVTVSRPLEHDAGCAEAQPQEGAVLLAFSVQDTGIGLSPEARGSIFEPFRQGDGSMTRRFGGTGLGLAIAHKVAQTLGGMLDVESEEGKGSTFRFCVPFVVSDGTPPPAS